MAFLIISKDEHIKIPKKHKNFYFFFLNNLRYRFLTEEVAITVFDPLKSSKKYMKVYVGKVK